MFRWPAITSLLATLVLGCGETGKDSDKKLNHGATQSIARPSENPTTPSQNVVTASGKQRIEFSGSRGDKVPAYLFHPGTAGRLPTVMVQYGIVGDKNDSKIEQVASVLNQNGFIALVIDVPGRGERTTQTGDIDPVQTVLNQDLFRWYVADYGAAANYLASRPDVDTARMAYMGASWGAITGIPFVAREQRMRAVVSIVGGGGFFGVIPQDLDPQATIRQIAPRPIMLINATRDQVVLEPFWKALHNAAPPSSQKILLDTDHTLGGVDLNQLMGQVIQFLKNALQ